MTAFGELTWNEAMERGHAALIESERLYDDINASEGRSNLDIEKHLRRADPGPSLVHPGRRAWQPRRTVRPPRDLGEGRGDRWDRPSRPRIPRRPAAGPAPRLLW